MKTKLSLGLAIMMIISSCGIKNKELATQLPDFPIKIDLVAAISNPKNIKLSEIADSIKYIPLEYVNDHPVGAILDFKYFQDNIFIHVGGNDGGFLRFDGNGNFLNEIGKIGRGPGEYTFGSKFSVIENPERFYIKCNFNPHNLLEYDFRGNFITKVFTANPTDGDFEAISPDRFLFLANSIQRIDTSAHYMACLTDRNNTPLMMIDHPFFSDPKNESLDRFFYGGAGSGVYYNNVPLFFDKNSLDIIFSIQNDSIYPKYILDKGNEGAPFEKLYSYSLTPERYNYLSPVAFNETPNDVFVLSIFKDELYLFNYNKSSHSVSSMKTPYVVPDMEHIRQPVTTYPKFENDIDGGLSLGFGKPNKEGDIWTFKFDASFLKSQLSKEHFIKSTAQFPEKKKALMQLVDSLEELDNPIIEVIYLKKELK